MHSINLMIAEGEQMDTKIYEYLVNVEKEKNISKAAEISFISQPALTQHIKRIERECGFSIFYRKNGEWLPTEKGKIYLTMAKRSIVVEHEMNDAIRALPK